MSSILGLPPGSTPFWFLPLILASLLSPYSPVQAQGPGGAPPGFESWEGVALGGTPSAGSHQTTTGELTVTAQGAGLGARADQGYFVFTRAGTNAFDVKVKVTSLNARSLLTRAGLMVREDTTNSAVMAAMVVTPGLNGAQFLTRTAPDGVAAVSGQFPANLPHAWLRLQRSNDLVRGFASLDGREWTPVGQASLTVTNAYLGVAVSSATTNAVTQATFRDWADASADTFDPAPPPFEPPGPSSRRTALTFSEIHYHPLERHGAAEEPLQFVEFLNTDFTDKPLEGHRLQADGLQFVFPRATVLPAGGRLVVAQNPARLLELYPNLPADRVLGPWNGQLSRNADTLQLWSPFQALLLEVPYRDEEPWPLAADGEGHSLVLARPSWGEADPRAWSASSEPGGSPGNADAHDADPRGNLRISEVFAGTADETGPFLEVFNAGTAPSPLEGLVATGPARTQAPVFGFSSGTLPPGARTTLQLPSSLIQLPSPFFLRDASSGRVWDAVTFSGAAQTHSFARARFDQPELRRVATPTPGRTNAPLLHARIVVSELMYRPITGRDDDQYLELWNPGSESVSLSGWSITGGISFTFPAGIQMPPDARLVVARNSARLLNTYPTLSRAAVVGEFSGRLSSRGERVALRDASGAIECAFTYRPGGEWPSLADGGGSSLELLHPHLDPNLGSSWAASDESARAEWQTHEITGRLEGGNGTINDIRILLLDPGETLIDNVEVQPVDGANLLNNPDFESGITGWTAGGTHERSGLESSGGFNGSAQALRLRAASRGDNGINSVRAALRTGLRAGTNTTLRLRTRWLSGTRDLLLRVKGNYLELPVRLSVPEDLGTPARANSRSLPAARIALSDLAHAPVLPADGQPVRVTVRISAHATNTLRPVLRHRIEPSTEFADPLPMNDDGQDGDRVAGDGIFTALLPGRPARTAAAFHVTIGDGDAPFRAPSSTTSTNREALVRWGDPQPAGNLGTYRIWITRAVESRWSSRPKMHNGDLDATFVYGNSRAVYGLGALYSGSPFVSPGYNGPAGSTLCGYVLHFPEDDAFLGETDFVMDWPIRDDARQLEQRAYEFAAEIGLPYLHRRFIHLYLNGTKRGAIYEDTQQPNSAYLRQWSPGDDDGNLLKIEDWFEFNTSGEREFNSDAMLGDFRRSDGNRDTARYRWSFRPRAVQENAHDFSALFRLIDAATAPTSLIEYQRDLEREMDLDAWAGVFAIEHAVGNWDSFGYSRGKNMFAYRPERGPWRLFMWDIDFVMSAGGDGPGNWPFSTIDPTIAALYQYAPFQRAYWRAIKKLVNGPMLTDRFLARTEAVRLGLLDNGVTSVGIAAARNYVRSQRESLMAQLSEIDRPFSVTSSLQNGSTADPLLRLQGEGPVNLEALRVNGLTYPVTWFTPQLWFAVVPLPQGRNTLLIAPVDGSGQSLGATRNITATLTSPEEPETLRVVIHEILTQPKNPGASFVELHNPSASQSLSLAGLQLVGAGTYTFPDNAALNPGQYLVLGNSFSAMQAEFGRTASPAGLLPWAPNPDGETIALVRPASDTNPAVTLTAVTYRPDGPWPTSVPGRSLQLRDASRGEDDRVGNWRIYQPSTNASAWKSFSVTGTAGNSASNLLLYVSSYPPALEVMDLTGRWTGTLSSFGFNFAVEFSRNAAGSLTGQLLPLELGDDPDLTGSTLGAIVVSENGAINFTWLDLAGRFSGRIDASGRRATGNFTFEGGSSSFTLTRALPSGSVWLDDLRLTRVGDDANLLRDGGFDTALGDAWIAQGPHTASSLVTDDGNPVLRLATTLSGLGAPTNAVIQSVPGLAAGTDYVLSGRYRADDARGLVVRLDPQLTFAVDLRPRVTSGPDATPGRANSVTAQVAPFPSLWLNEVSPENLGGLRDASGEAEPWLELHNSGSTPLLLDGYALSTDPLQLDAWNFPAGTAVPPGGFLLVWLDGEPSEGTPAEPHASFRAHPRDGVIILSRGSGATHEPVDSLHYTEIPAGRSFGHLPEAWVHADTLLPQPSPRQPNGSDTSATPRVRINEWMASNDGSFRDPADLDADDWFELVNAGNAPVDLSGWFLSDSNANLTKFRIPAGYRLPAGGYLLVWADEESSQNQASPADLHVNFRLAAGGEELLLVRPDGTIADRVVFAAQQAGVSEGRQPDGSDSTPFVRFPAPSPGKANSRDPADAPSILAAERRPDGSIAIRFTAQPGRTYRLRTKDDLASPEWSPTQARITAAEPTAQLIWPQESGLHRFFLIEREP